MAGATYGYTAFGNSAFGEVASSTALKMAPEWGVRMLASLSWASCIVLSDIAITEIRSMMYRMQVDDSVTFV